MTNPNPPEVTVVQLGSAVPTFPVADVGLTAVWYQQQLGFEASFFPDAAPYAYASLGRDCVEIMLLRLEGYEKPDLTALRPEGVWDAYIRMQGVKTFFESVRGRDFVRTPLVKRGYGDWEFEIRDPNGYVLVFSELID